MKKKYIIKNVFANKISSSELNNIFKNLKTKYLKVLNKLTSIIPKKISESLKEDVNLDGNLVNLINPKIHSFTMQKSLVNLFNLDNDSIIKE